MSNHDVIINWIKKAENDLRNAKIVIKAEDPPHDTICFHAQQCIEKYIKALLVYYKKEPPKLHDIGELITALKDEMPELYQILDEADELTDYAIGIRYPEEIFDISSEDSKKAVKTAEKIKNIALKNLPEEIKKTLKY